MKSFLILSALFISIFSPVFSQPNDPIIRSWNAFGTKVNVRDYEGYDFRLSALVKSDTMSVKSAAHLWARVDLRKGWGGFFDNMIDRPIVNSEWKTYTIEGEIDAKADSLVFGGLCFNQGKYYFNDFSLELRAKGGEWFAIELPHTETVWNEFEKVKGFEFDAKEYHSGSGPIIVNGENNFSYGNNSKHGKYLSVNGVKLYYEVYGEGDPLVLLHGNSQSIDAFRNQIPVLSEKHTVIAVDTRGQGNSSENGEYLSYELFAEDVLQLLDALGLKRVDLLGWSDGGNTGLVLAMNHPDRIGRLAVMGAVLYNDKTSVKSSLNFYLKKAYKKMGDENSFEKRMLFLLLNEPNITPEELNKIESRVLVMAGSNDVVKEKHTLLIASSIKKSQLVIFEKGTHFEPTENPERFNKAVVDFFE